MSLYDEVPLSDLDRKARQVFGEQVVPKSLAQQAVFHGLPRYVSEYLIAKYVRPETWQDDLAKVQAKIKDLLPDIERRELVKDRLLRMGEAVLIDYVEARVDLKNGQRWARVPAINDEKVRVSAALLTSGNLSDRVLCRFWRNRQEFALKELGITGDGIGGHEKGSSRKYH